MRRGLAGREGQGKAREGAGGEGGRGLPGSPLRTLLPADLSGAALLREVRAGLRGLRAPRGERGLPGRVRVGRRGSGGLSGGEAYADLQDTLEPPGTRPCVLTDRGS